MIGLLFSAALLARLPSDSVIDRLDRINAYYYNPAGEEPACVGAYDGDVAVAGSSAEDKIWSGLTSFMSEEQAAGVMGNLAYEGGFNPVRRETSMLNRYGMIDLSTRSDLSYGVGLAQWSFGRRTGLMNYIKSKDASLLQYFENESYARMSGDQFTSAVGDTVANTLIAYELEYLRDEVNSKYSGLYSTSSASDAATYFLEKFERPANPTISAHPERARSAGNYYSRYSGSTISGGESSGGCVTASGSAGYYGSSESTVTRTGTTSAGSLQELVLAWAWPEPHAAPFTERRTAYAEVVEKRQAEGKYVGGSANGVAGIDCGGFVTALMQESGFAPNYNSGGGSTSAQETWVKNNGWTRLNPSGPIDTSTLQPGDVAFTTGHTFVYVGNIPGFSSNIASASIGGRTARAPMAGRESLTYGSGGIVRWYRKP